MLNYIILGIIQGIFEWIPISSQGIVAIASHFLIENVHPLETALFLHLGTIFAVLIYFKKEWIKVLSFKDKNLYRFLIISTIITGIVGFFLYETIKNITIGNTLLIITGFGLLITAYFHKKKIMLKIGSDKLAVIAGFLQGLAVIPGLSRSGATIFGLSLAKSKAEEILKISYMMSVPAVFGMTLFLFFKNPVLISDGWPALLSSFLFGFLTLNFLLKFSVRVNFFKFALFFSFLCFLGAVIGFII